MSQAGKGDLKTLANGLFPAGFDAATLTPEGRDEVRAAVDVILKIHDQRFARLTLALEQIDKAAVLLEAKDAEIASLKEDARASSALAAENFARAKKAEAESERLRSS